MTLQNKRIIVTGGASGMGAASAAAFAAEGAQVAIFDISEVAGLEVVSHCNAGERVHFWRCDVTEAESVQAVFAAAVQRMGGLDVLVHCAGIAPGAKAENIALVDWERVFAVNARGTFLTNQTAFPYLKEHGGRIINFASGAGVGGYVGKAHYAATKGAVLAWTRSIAREWGGYGIIANAIVPAISTPMYAKTRSEMSAEQLAAHDRTLLERIPLGGKLGDPALDLAPVLVFLAGDGSRFITGQTLAVDGGMVMLT